MRHQPSLHEHALGQRNSASAPRSGHRERTQSRNAGLAPYAANASTTF